MGDRDTKGRFVKGCKSIGGRPSGSKGIAVYIKEQTDDLRELVDMSLLLLRDNNTVTRDKIALLNLLMDRAIGKPIQQSFVDATLKTELDDLLEELEDDPEGEAISTSEELEE